MPRKLLIVEDHPLFSEALQLVLAGSFPGVHVETAATLERARAVLARGIDFDLVLLDLWLPDTKGLDGLVILRQQFPKLPILVVSAFSTPSVVRRVMTCGAAGFIAKASSRARLIGAIGKVLRGEVVVSDEASQRPVASASAEHAWRLQLLTQQQLRVLYMLCQGMLNKQIAHELGVGETTVKAHVSEILRKLGVSSRTQAVLQLSSMDFEGLASIASPVKAVRMTR